MKHAQFLRIKKLTGKAIIEVAARHNCREILAEIGAAPGGNIDPARVGLNRILHGHGTAAAVAIQAQTLMNEAGIKATRKDAVKALEIIFGLSPQSTIDHAQFFDESVQWAAQYFKAPIISAIVHNDEAAPHCHVLLLPLVDGRMIGSDLMGGRAKLQAMQADFHINVGERHGLTRQAAQKRCSAETRQKAIDSAFDVLEANSGLSDTVLLALLLPHLNDPVPLLLALGLTMPLEKVKPKGTFVGIMTRPCKPERKPIGFGMSKPIGFDAAVTSEKGQTLSCVGFDKITLSFSPSNAPSITNNGTGTTSKAAMMEPVTDSQTPPAPESTDTEGSSQRERDNEQLAAQWADDLGKFIKPTTMAPCKPAVIASVHTAPEAACLMQFAC
ncbi:plasmid recombination protein [Glaciimonas sp. GNP009]